MTGRTALLNYADQVLDGLIDLGPRAARTAALLARMALEDWVDEQSGSWCVAGAKPPTTTSKLVVLGWNKGADVGERARRVWHSLSRAVHHHAYELQPSPAEVRHLVSQVRDLAAAAAPPARPADSAERI
jgi:hypothetical protein